MAGIRTDSVRSQERRMSSPITPSAWVVLALGDQRKYAGNTGYADEVEHAYRYDSFVQYYRQLAVGDVLLIKGPAGILGMAQIQRIVVQDGTKEQRKCPVCRRTVASSNRCKKNHRFERALVEMVECRRYVAEFGDSFMRLERVSMEQVRKTCPGIVLQMAIKPLQFSELQSHLVATNPAVSKWIDSQLAVDDLGAADASAGDPGAYAPSDQDARRETLRQIKLRRGQREFRDALRTRYGDRCLITGCPLLDIVEAAHINPYRGDADNHVENGLLLRADIHTLYDLHLLAIHPRTLRVNLHPAAAAAGYHELEGKRLRVKGHRPSEPALLRRWQIFQCAASKDGAEREERVSVDA